MYDAGVKMYPQAVRLLWVLPLVVSLVSAFSWPLPQDRNSNTSSTKAKQAKHDKPTSEASHPDGSKKTGKLDLNTATKDQLDALTGIGDTFAQKIIEGRPYKSKSDLVRKGVLPSSTYDKIKDQVTARQAPTSESSEPMPTGSVAARPEKPSAAQRENSSTKRSEQTMAETNTAQTPPEKGTVWVNLNSGVYHREGDRWYGKTKNGKFMSEADAQRAGYRVSRSGSKDAEKEQ